MWTHLKSHEDNSTSDFFRDWRNQSSTCVLIGLREVATLDTVNNLFSWSMRRLVHEQFLFVTLLAFSTDLD